jgi:drug/metabolite transporter (DMT)-like permease
VDYSGYLAALGTSVCFACGSVLFTLSGRAIGSSVVNRTRLVLAAIFLLIMHLISLGTLLPQNVTPDRVFWLAASGIVGLALGDFFLFQAFVVVGPRLAMLIFALSPVLSSILAFIFFGEQLTMLQIVGIVVTMIGIVLVVTEARGEEKEKRKPKTDDTVIVIEDDGATPGPESRTLTQSEYLWGLFYAFLAACGQTGGVILSKQGLSDDFSPISANLIRMTAAVVAIWFVTIVNRQAGHTLEQLRKHVSAIWKILVATILGPVVGVLLTLYSLQHAPIGVSSTLGSLMPIILIPISFVVFGERITLRGMIATIIAFAGIALIFVK